LWFPCLPTPPHDPLHFTLFFPFWGLYSVFPSRHPSSSPLPFPRLALIRLCDTDDDFIIPLDFSPLSVFFSSLRVPLINLCSTDYPLRSGSALVFSPDPSSLSYMRSLFLGPFALEDNSQCFFTPHNFFANLMVLLSSSHIFHTIIPPFF